MLTIKLSGPQIETMLVALMTERDRHRDNAKRYKKFSNQVAAEDAADELNKIIRLINNQL